MCHIIPGGDSDPAFMVPHSQGSVPFTYVEWQNRLRAILTLIGQNPTCYCSHSFRRGGATFAHRAGVPAKLIKLMGDWHSKAYERYLHVAFQDKNRAATSVARAVAAM